jgi:hypothetical protein
MNDTRDESLGDLLDRVAVGMETTPPDRLDEILRRGSRRRAGRLVAIGAAVAMFAGAVSWAGLSLPGEDAGIPANVADWRAFASLMDNGWTIQVPPPWRVQELPACPNTPERIGVVVTNTDFRFVSPRGTAPECDDRLVFAGFPRAGVAFAFMPVGGRIGVFRLDQPDTRFPLSPDRLKSSGGIEGGPTESFLDVQVKGGVLAYVRRWVGPEASPEDVTALDRIIGSLQVRGASRWTETEGTTNILHDERRHYSVTYPQEWTVADENLTPWLVSPEEILSIGTFPLRVSQDPEDGLRVWDAPVAPAALADMTTEDAFLSVQESGNVDPDFFESRPLTFGPLGCEEAIFPCGAENWQDVPFLAWWIPFRDEGRSFYLFVAIGNEATRELREEAWEVADRLAFEPDAG